MIKLELPENYQNHPVEIPGDGEPYDYISSLLDSEPMFVPLSTRVDRFI